MKRSYDNVLAQIESGEVLLHGTSLDAALQMLRDDFMDCEVRDFAGPSGVSLTRSLDVTREFRTYWEEQFDDALAGHYDVDEFLPGEQRFGAIFVFARENLKDLRVEPYEDDESPDEQEERVFGNVDQLRSRLAAILIADGELEWFRNIVDTRFRAVDGNADKMLAILDENKHLFVHAQVPARELTAFEAAI